MENKREKEPLRFFRIRNYEQYQGKKSDRNSLPWIKLHKKIMNDYAYGSLRASEQLMFIHMLLVADSVSNRFVLDAKWMRTKLGVNAKWNFTSFESKGLIEIIGTHVKSKKPPRREEKRREEKTPLSEIQSPPPERFSEKDFKTAEFIFKKLKVLLPTIKKPNLESWTNDIRLIREQDKKTDDQIRELFTWANSNNFWRTNILSPKKLRAQWDMLILKKTGVSGKNGNSYDSDGRHIKNKFKQIMAVDLQNPGVENWPHEIQQLLIKLKQYKNQHGSEALDLKQIEFLESRLTELQKRNTA